MRRPSAIILGCGFTGSRVAKMLLVRGFDVFAASRTPERLARLVHFGVKVRGWMLASPSQFPDFPANSLLLHSVPETSEGEASNLERYIERLQPSRVVYLSTTSVYGRQAVVNERSAADSGDEKARRRISAELFVQGGDWSSMILRPAAIYGPQQGVHVQLRRGREPRSNSTMVSRIHVEDLAAHAEAGLLSSETGVFPVADEQPCSSREIADYCRRLMGLSAEAGETSMPISIPGRAVDGRAIRQVLGLELRYPSYETGILASIAEEAMLANSSPEE